MKNNDEGTKHASPGSTSSSEVGVKSFGTDGETETGRNREGFTSRHVAKILTAAVILIAVALLASGIGLMFFSDFMVFELDYSDSQREVANSTSKVLSLLGFMLLILSTGLLLLSSRIARLMVDSLKNRRHVRR